MILSSYNLELNEEKKTSCTMIHIKREYTFINIFFVLVSDYFLIIRNYFRNNLILFFDMPRLNKEREKEIPAKGQSLSEEFSSIIID